MKVKIFTKLMKATTAFNIEFFIKLQLVLVERVEYEEVQKIEQKVFVKKLGKDKTMVKLSEHTAKPPYILGNFSRIEIIFVCEDKVQTKTTPQTTPQTTHLKLELHPCE